MATAFKEARRLQGERVRMQFDDGREVVAVLLCATKDIEGSKHLIYSQAESLTNLGESACIYADAKTLVNIERADVSREVRGPNGRTRLTLRNQIGQGFPPSPRPNA